MSVFTNPAGATPEQVHDYARAVLGLLGEQEARDQFAALRQSNLRIMDLASEEDWKRTGVHAVRGEQTLRVLLQWWAGHDLLHLRQVDRICRVVQR